MASQPGETRFYRILVAIETDATRFYGADAKRPALLGNSDAEQLLAHVAADLKALLPEVSHCSLILAGALYDQTQVLCPSYPVFRSLEATATSAKAEDFKAGLVSIAAQAGKMPAAGLQPGDNIPLGPLQLLPVVLHGPAQLVNELGQQMEYRFLEEGQVSAHSAAWMQTAFSVSISHARFMTLTDLNAMLRLQLEHFGFLPLWELLDAALSAGHQAERQGLAEGYGNWTREIRQYLTTLNAHGLDVRFTRRGSDKLLEGTFFKQPAAACSEGDATITEHSFAELGTVAITVCSSDRVDHYYPLCPDGLNDIHAHIRQHVPGVHTVAFPGTILYDEKSRTLLPDPSQSKTRH